MALAVALIGGCRIGYEHLDDARGAGGGAGGEGAAAAGTEPGASGGVAGSEAGAGGSPLGATGGTTVGGEGGEATVAGAAGGGGVAPSGGSGGVGASGGTDPEPSGASGGTGSGGDAGASAAAGGSGAAGEAGANAAGGSAGSSDGTGGGATGGGAGIGGSAVGGGGTGGITSGGDAGATGTGGTEASGGASDTGGGGGAAGATTAGGAGTGGTGGAASPGDYHVTTALDESDAGATVESPGGTGLSLREALALANAAAGIQSITFEPGLSIALGSGLGVTDGVEIRGDGTALRCDAVGGAVDCLTLAAAAGTTVVTGLTLSGARNNPIHVASGSGYEITGCVLDSNVDPLEIASVASDVTVRGCRITGSGADGIAVLGAGVTIVDNTIVDSALRGIFLGTNASGARVIGNLVVRGDRGILLANVVTGVVLRHNTLVYQAGDGLVIGSANAAEVTNNVFAFAGDYGLIASDASIEYRDYNAYFGNGLGACSTCTLEAHAVTADPGFVDAAADDFTLRADSPLVDAGTPTDEDRNGARSGLYDGLAPDIGYWEQP